MRAKGKRIGEGQGVERKEAASQVTPARKRSEQEEGKRIDFALTSHARRAECLQMSQVPPAAPPP